MPNWTNWKTIEIVGTVLVLMSAGFEVFIQRPLAAMEQSSDVYKQDLKLDSVWMLLVDLYSKENPDRMPRMFTNVEHLNEAWKDAGENEPDPLNKQAKTAAWITGLTFLVGSVLLLAAKIKEHRNR